MPTPSSQRQPLPSFAAFFFASLMHFSPGRSPPCRTSRYGPAAGGGLHHLIGTPARRARSGSLERRADLGPGLVWLSLGEQSAAELVSRLRVGRGLGKFSPGLRRPPQGEKHEASLERLIRTAAGQRRRAVEVGERALPVSEAGVEVGAVAVRLRRLRRELERSAEILQRELELAAPGEDGAAQA